MKLMHLSDLHIGKRLIELSMLEDQRYIFEQILEIMDREQPDAVLIAGDVYDRADPTARVMGVFDELLNKLAARGKPVLIISGNHDSAQLLTFARDFMEQEQIHVSPVYSGHIDPVTLTDEYGPVRLWMMPYVHPDNVAPFFPERSIRNANDAAEAVISEMAVDPAQRNVILSHQFIAGGTTSDSERKNVGTLENVSPEVYNAFDYVALGHLHRPQRVGREDGTMRYSGTPLVYSRSELGAEKTVTMVELGEKGRIAVREIPLTPLHQVRLVQGSFDGLMAAGPEEGTEDDYYFVELTDENDIPNAAPRLRERFPRMLYMSYNNERTRSFAVIDAPEAVEEKDPMELMMELYQLMHEGREMSDEAAAFLREAMKKVGGMQV